MRSKYNFVDDYLNNFDLLKKYNKVYVTEDLTNLNKTHISNNSIILYIPSNKDFNKKIALEDIEIKKIEISKLFNKNVLKKWKIDFDSINFVEKNFNLITKRNYFHYKIIYKYLDKRLGKDYIKLQLLPLIKDFFLYLYINKTLKRYNKNITFLLKENEIKYYHKIYSKNFFFDNIDIDFININYCNKEKIKNFLKILIFPIYSIFKAIKYFRSDNYQGKIHIRQYRNGIGINSFPYLSEDWIVDKKRKKKDIVFVLEDMPNERQIKNLSKYTFIHANSSIPIHVLKIKNLYKIIFRYLFPYIYFSVSSFFAKGIVKKIFKEFLIEYFIWDNFFTNYKNIKYLTYHNHQPSHIIRNFFIGKSGSKSFNYRHTFSENIFHKKIKKFYSTLYYFSFFDFEFHMSRISSKINTYNKKKINLISGPVWSSKKFENLKMNFPSNKTVISFFASSYNYSGVNMFEDHYGVFKFLKKISNIPNVLIIFKGKGDFFNYCRDKRIYEIFSKLKKANKILIMNKNISARYIINSSDITISMPFSTPTFEALYLKKACFFLDINNSYKNSYVDFKTKSFVAHSPSEGLNILKIFLKDKKVFQKYINYNFKKIYEDEHLSKLDPIDLIKEKINKF